MELRNYTPHKSLTFQGPFGSVSLPHLGSARCAEEVHQDGFYDPEETLPRTVISYGDVTGLPAPEPGVLFVVSQLVIGQLPERNDLAFPSDLVRDADGSIVGFRRLARPAGARGYDPDGPVFISYRREGEGLKIANDLDALLQAVGVPVWRDERDLSDGNIKNAIHEAMDEGLSGGIVVLTPEVADSEFIRNVEVPRLLVLEEEPTQRFKLAVVAELEGDVDGARVGDLLGVAPDRVEDVLRYDTSDDRSSGVVGLARQKLKDYLDGHLRAHPLGDRPFVIDVQTRLQATASMAREGDLHMRLDWGRHRAPARAGLEALRRTLVMLTDDVEARRVETVRFQGGMHLSVALALGVGFSTTRGYPRVLECFHRTTHQLPTMWSSRDCAGPTERRIEELPVDHSGPVAADGQGAAVLVTLSPHYHVKPFTRAVETKGPFSSVHHLCLKDTGTPLAPADGAAIAAELGRRLRDLTEAAGGGDLHLFFQGPWAVAVLLGQKLNTLKVVTYELDDEEVDESQMREVYVPCLRLESGAKPISEVLLVDERTT